MSSASKSWQFIEQCFYGFDQQGGLQSVSSPYATAWLATATFSSNSEASKQPSKTANTLSYHRSLQSIIVRQLLQHLIKMLQPTAELWLDDSTFPYSLQPIDYAVCFSHCKNQVSCALRQKSGLKCRIGIDTELNTIPLSVAMRFFHPDDLNWLSTLEAQSRQQATKLLWMLKEARIKKMSQHNDAQLIGGLGVNLLTLAQDLFQQSFCKSSASDIKQDSAISCSTVGRNVVSTDTIATSHPSYIATNETTVYVHLPSKNTVMAM